MKINSTELIRIARKRSISVAIVAVTLIASLVTNSGHSRRYQQLLAQRGSEAKTAELMAEINRLERKLNSSRGLFSSDLNSSVNSLAGMVKDSKLRLISSKLEPEESGRLYIRNPIFLAIEAGSYHDIGRFVSLIENQPEFYAIDALDIQQIKTETAQVKPKLLVSLRVSVFSLKAGNG